MSGRFARQDFLGPNSPEILRRTTIGIVGLSGGGSHLAQQSAHVGFGEIVLIDPDTVSESNTHRLVGIEYPNDVIARRPKTEVAARMIGRIDPEIRTHQVAGKWQDAALQLRRCDLIFGALDEFNQRDGLEAFARRFLIPYIDIGMDVHGFDRPFVIGGQAVLSTPGFACLRCLGIVTDARVQEEAQRYGALGGNPQVIWPNGILASLAVGFAVQLLCPWTDESKPSLCRELDGNAHVVEAQRQAVADQVRCAHHLVAALGDRFFRLPGVRQRNLARLCTEA